MTEQLYDKIERTAINFHINKKILEQVSKYCEEKNLIRNKVLERWVFEGMRRAEDEQIKEDIKAGRIKYKDLIDIKLRRQRENLIIAETADEYKEKDSDETEGEYEIKPEGKKRGFGKDVQGDNEGRATLW